MTAQSERVDTDPSGSLSDRLRPASRETLISQIQLLNAKIKMNMILIKTLVDEIRHRREGLDLSGPTECDIKER